MQAFESHLFDVPYPNGESGRDAWERAYPVLREITASGLENAALIAHGGIIRVLLAGVLGLSQERRFYLGNPPENCSISLLQYESVSKHFYLHTFNDYTHLGDSMNLTN